MLFLPFPVATFLWFWLTLLFLLASATGLWRVWTTGDSRRRVHIAWVATLFFMPALFALRIGQISGLILVGIVGFLFFVTKGKGERAGFLLVLTLIKPHIVYLFLIAVGWWILKERRWRVLGGFLGAITILMAATWLISPYSLFYYWQSFSQAPPMYWCPTTLGGGLRYLLGPEHIWLQFVPPVVGSLLLVVFLLCRRPTICWSRDLSLLLLSIPTSAYGWVIDQVVLLPPYLLTLAWFVEWKEKRSLHLYLLPGSLLLINGLMLGQNLLRMEEIYFLWVPVALGLIYLYGWWSLKQRPSAVVLEG